MIYKILMTFLMLIFVVASIIAALWVSSAIEDRYVKINELPMPEKQSKRIFNFFLYLFIFLSIVIYIVFDMAVKGHISLPADRQRVQRRVRVYVQLLHRFRLYYP